LYNKDTIQDLINQELKIFARRFNSKVRKDLRNERKVSLIVRMSPAVKTVGYVLMCIFLFNIARGFNLGRRIMKFALCSSG